MTLAEVRTVELNGSKTVSAMDDHKMNITEFSKYRIMSIMIALLTVLQVLTSIKITMLKTLPTDIVVILKYGLGAYYTLGM